MGTVTKPFTFASGATIYANAFNEDFDTLYNEFNGNIDNSNIKAGAGIEGSKIASSPNGIGTNQINDNAVTAAKLRSSATVDADRAVTSDHVRDNAILNRHLWQQIIATENMSVRIQSTAISFALAGGTNTHWVEGTISRKVSGDHYVFEIRGLVWNSGTNAFFWGTSGDVTPANQIYTASYDLFGVYLSNIAYNGVNFTADLITIDLIKAL